MILSIYERNVFFDFKGAWCLVKVIPGTRRATTFYIYIFNYFSRVGLDITMVPWIYQPIIIPVGLG